MSKTQNSLVRFMSLFFTSKLFCEWTEEWRIKKDMFLELKGVLYLIKLLFEKNFILREFSSISNAVLRIY